MKNKGVHKETFHQSADSGIPGHWVVLWWDEDKNPASDFNDAEYFGSLAEAVEFENSLTHYSDWASSQEIELAVQ